MGAVQCGTVSNLITSTTWLLEAQLHPTTHFWTVVALTILMQCIYAVTVLHVDTVVRANLHIIKKDDDFCMICLAIFRTVSHLAD